MDLMKRKKEITSYAEIFDSAEQIGEGMGVILASLIDFK